MYLIRYFNRESGCYEHVQIEHIVTTEESAMRIALDHHVDVEVYALVQTFTGYGK